ncbi:MAG: Na/Pi cotransporter family protein [Oscillospiraceae bacterium]|jgi:phosphate:Na+ symporter|nr:Na/Pi cotransporter family protein [Oscillospiraceae bacterium]
MGIFDVFALLGGLAFFLFGMNVMSGGLEKLSGGKLEKNLRTVTSGKLRGFALGLGVTAVIQSSSAMTVMLVGLVNSGIMTLHQTVSVVMGTNIGTTVTAWLLSLAGITSKNFFISLFKPENFSPILAFIGIVLLMFAKKQRKRDAGTILVGFAVLMFGMTIMKDSVAGLSGSESFKNILTAFSNPILGILVGMLFTAIIQSSSASVGLLQTFAASVGVTYGAAIPIIMGQNIGTCITALISSIGVTKNARRVAFVHVYFNIIGTLFYFLLIYGFNLIFKFSFLTENVSAFGVAIIHSVFNVTVTALLMPFSALLEKLAILTVPIKNTDTRTMELLDDRLLATPSFALANCRDLTVRMCETAGDAAMSAIDLIGKYSPKAAEGPSEAEKMLDTYEDKLGTYLVKLSSKELATADSWEVSRLLRAIGDLERIGDHAVNIIFSAQELAEKNIVFSEQGTRDLSVLNRALADIVILTMRAFSANDRALAREVEPLEQVIDLLVKDARLRHIDRIQKGQCNIGAGFILTDILVNQERISDHCSNIAVGLIQMESGSMESHQYLLRERSADNAEFVAAFERCREKYAFE